MRLDRFFFMLLAYQKSGHILIILLKKKKKLKQRLWLIDFNLLIQCPDVESLCPHTPRGELGRLAACITF